MPGPMVVRGLGIPVERVFVDFSTGMKMIRSGEVAGLLGVVSKPVDFWSKIPPNTGLHLLPVPYSKALADLYVIGGVTNADYPNLITPGERIGTISEPAELAVFNLSKKSHSYRLAERFGQSLVKHADN